MPAKNNRFELLKKKEAMLKQKATSKKYNFKESSDRFHKSFTIENHHAKTVEQFVKENTSNIYQKLSLGKKVNFRLSITMVRFSSENEEKQVFHFSKPNYILTERKDYKNAVLSLIEFFNMKISETEEKGTGWQMQSIDSLSFHLYDIMEEIGGCFQTLPDKLYNRKVFAIIYSKNNECFKDCVEYLTSDDTLNFEGIQYPSGRRDIMKFEKNNPKYLIYVYSYDTSYGVFYKHKNFHEESKTRKVLNIFLYKNHFFPIKNEQFFQRMMFKVKKRKVFVCKDCLTKYNSQDELNHHHTYCQKEYKMKLNYPCKGKVKQFNEFYALHKMPFLCFLDIECCLKKVDIKKGKTTLEQEHVGTHFGLIFVNRLEQKHEKYIFRSVPELKDKLNELKNHLNLNIPLVGEERKKATIAFSQETHCYACGDELKEDREKDHCHFTGKFRGIACKSCNMRMQGPDYLPIFAHNMTGYDSKLLIRELDEELKLIPKNSENFIIMETKCRKGGIKLRFLDSYNFLPTSLENLAKDLEPSEFKITRKVFGEDSDLFLKKGYFPYSFYDDVKKLKVNHLPSQYEFYNKMKEVGISDENYEHCKKVWKTRHHQTFEDYLIDYLLSDCTILADVFLFFLDRMYREYGLDASYFFTLPHFGYTCLLKFTGQKLELLSDPTMYNMVERGIRGGFCTLVKRKALANNPYMKNYNPDIETSYLWDLDANNLYGNAMCEELPVGNFKWGSLDWEHNGKCFVDVDIFIPCELKPKFEQYPLCPERKDGKLIADFYEKKGYVCHSDYLRSILKKGYKIKKVNNCITFDSKDWIKPFILKNTELRKQSKSVAESNFFKLLNNSVYGKQIEDVRNRVNMMIVKAENLRREMKKSNFKRLTPLIKNELYLVELDYTSLTLDKPIYGGLSILDYSKIHMHDFLYDYIYPKFNDNVELVYSDTDSLILQVYCDDLYEKIIPDIEQYFDTSNFPDDFRTLSGNPIPKMNKKVLGKFKDEKVGTIPTHLYGLRPKMYIMEPGGDKKIKGVSEAAQKKITSKDFDDIIMGRNHQIYGTMRNFRSRNHIIFTESQYKLILDGNDTKRQVLEDNIHTLPWGY